MIPAALVLAVLVELGALHLGPGFLSPSLATAAAVTLWLGPQWALIAVTLALVVRTILKGEPKAMLADFVPAGMVVAAYHSLGPWAWAVLAIAAVPLPILLWSKLAPGSQALRIREELVWESLALASLGPLALTAGPLLLPIALGVRHSAKGRAELGRYQTRQGQLRQEKRDLTVQARQQDATHTEQEQREHRLTGQAQAFQMLEGLGARPLTETEALQESLRLLAERLPGCSGAVFNRQQQAELTWGPPAQPDRRLLDGQPHIVAGEGSTVAVWPLGERLLWIGSPVPLMPDTLATLDTFVRYAALVLERAGFQQRQATRAARLQAMLEAAPRLAAAVSPSDVHAVQPDLGPDEARMWDLLKQAAMDRLQAQASLVQGSKLAAIGQMAAGVAHELNTPLGAVTLAMDVALQSIDSRPDRARTRLEQALTATERMRSIVTKLLYYARATGQGKQPVNLAEVVRDSLQLLEQTFQLEKIEVQSDLHEVRVAVDPGEIQQVVVNLLVNAKGTGTPLILVRCGALGESQAFVDVEDRGPGIPAEVAERIFEPFFTTKDVGQGTGLGLSLSQEIARAHEGRLIWKNLAQGVVFRLELPR